MEQIKPDKRYLLAPEEDLNINLSLKTNFNDLNEFNNSRLVSLTDVFNDERNKSTKYRIYGNINFVSFLRNKKTTQSSISDFFNDDYLNTGYNLEDFFDIKIYKPIEEQDLIIPTPDKYAEKLTAITNDSHYTLSFFSYSKNIYNEKIYNFKFNSLNLNPYEFINLNNDFIYNNYVYLGFIPKNLNVYEKIYTTNDYVNTLDLKTQFGYSAVSFTNNQILNIVNGSNFDSVALFNEFLSAKTHNFFKVYDIKITDTNINLNKRFIRNYLDIGNGDYNQKIQLDLTQSALTGNLIYFDRENYIFNELIKKEYVIKLQLNDNNITSSYINENYSSFTYTINNNVLTIDFYFKFNPFYKVELKKYETTNEEIFDNAVVDIIPPDIAIRNSANNGTIWRNLMIYGNPENYDFPFLNDTHYYYNDIRFYLKPDISDRNTATLMKQFDVVLKDQNFSFNKNNLKIKKEEPKKC